uniref:Uncharacterized protein n=1 Tax=Vespula pensylvanica TaxID=30213 RepID=A0A834P048_VESPE|nr:hypothetical protein H0235_008584 [Vespula pensylvanica]
MGNGEWDGGNGGSTRAASSNALNEAHVKAAQRAATLSAVEQCGLCALPQGFQDAQQSEQSQEHLSS